MYFTRPFHPEISRNYPHNPRENRTDLQKIQDIMKELGQRYCIVCGAVLLQGNPWIICTTHEGNELNWNKQPKEAKYKTDYHQAFYTSLESLKTSLLAQNKVKDQPTKETWIKIYKKLIKKPLEKWEAAQGKLQLKFCFKCGISISSQNPAIALCCQNCSKDNGVLWGQWEEENKENQP